MKTELTGFHTRSNKSSRVRECEVEQILLENYQKYYRLAYSYTKNEDDALDVVQESACKAIKDCKKVKDKAYLATWLYRIVVNTAIDFIRKNHREESYENQLEPAHEDTYVDFDVMNSLSALDEKERTIIILRFFEDLKLEEIAKVTEESVSTIKSRLYRALKKLKIELSAEETT